MQIKMIKDALDAVVIEGASRLNESFDYIYASDLMSDVLAFGKPYSILLTGLATRQAVISAHMADFRGIVFIRGKKPKDGSKEFARVNNLVLLSTQMDMFDACTKLDAAMKHVSSAAEKDPADKNKDEFLLSREFFIYGSDFASAGMVSTDVKSLLKKIGFDPELVRKIAISTYEGEMNVVMHAVKATVRLFVTPQLIEVVIDDEGKGIPDVEMAMQEGFTTATEEMRAMGFGSGMGLPNIKKNTDELDISSETDKGTRLKMMFFI